METVAPAAALHDTAGLLVDDFDLTVLGDDVVDVFLEEGVGLEELVDGVDAVALDGEVAVDFLFFGGFFLGGEVLVLEFGDHAADVGELVEIAVLAEAGEEVHALVGEFDAALLLVDGEVEVVVDDVHVFVLLLHVEILGALEDGLDAGFGEELDERFVLRQTAVAAEEEFGGFLVGLGVGVFGEAGPGVGEDFGDQHALGVVEFFDDGFEAVELLVFVVLAGGAADDEGGTGIVDEHGVDLVDDGVVVAALDEFFGVAAHVVAEVVEAELVVGAVGDVGVVGCFALVAVGLMLVDAIDGEAVELEEHAHPLGVALGEVVVDGDDVDALAGQCVEIDGEGGDEGFTLAGGHLGDFAAVEHDAADELDVVVDHVPGDHVAARHPLVLIDGLVLPVVAGDDVDAVAFDGQFAVVVGGGDDHLAVFGEAASRFLDDAEGLGQNVVEDFLSLVVGIFLQFVDALVDFLFLVDGHVVLFLDALAQGGQFVLLGLDLLADALLELDGFGAELVVGEFLNLGINLKGGVEVGFDLFQVAVGLGAEQFG